MANGENTQKVTQFIGSLFSNVFAPITQQAQDTAKQVAIIDQTERVVMVIIIVGALWYFTKKNR